MSDEAASPRASSGDTASCSSPKPAAEDAEGPEVDPAEPFVFVWRIVATASGKAEGWFADQLLVNLLPLAFELAGRDDAASGQMEAALNAQGVELEKTRERLRARDGEVDALNAEMVSLKSDLQEERLSRRIEGERATDASGLRAQLAERAKEVEAGVVVLESPAIALERLAPLSFSSRSGVDSERSHAAARPRHPDVRGGRDARRRSAVALTSKQVAALRNWNVRWRTCQSLCVLYTIATWRWERCLRLFADGSSLHLLRKNVRMVGTTALTSIDQDDSSFRSKMPRGKSLNSGKRWQP